MKVGEVESRELPVELVSRSNVSVLSWRRSSEGGGSLRGSRREVEVSLAQTWPRHFYG